MVEFVGVSDATQIINKVGLEPMIEELAAYIEADFARWLEFELAPRLASHSQDGVIELMPTSDSHLYGFKYVNGHPKNTAQGLQTVAAFGFLSEVATGYPIFVSEMTLLTAVRTAAMSALAAKHLARPGSGTMAMIGLGAQSEFQALAFRRILGIDRIVAYDIDPAAGAKFVANLKDSGISIQLADDSASAVRDADIVTTATADKALATILTNDMIGPGIHINAVGGDCPGKTELDPAILSRASVFVELEAQTRIEGEIQQMPADFPVTELWQVITGAAPGRRSADEVTIFDSVGFAIEDFSALRLLRELASRTGHGRHIDLLAAPTDPRNLFGLLGADASATLARLVA